MRTYLTHVKLQNNCIRGRQNLVDQLEGVGTVEQGEICRRKRVLEQAFAKTGGVEGAEEAAVCVRNADLAENRLRQSLGGEHRVRNQTHLLGALDFLLIERAQHGHAQAREEPGGNRGIRRGNHVPKAELTIQLM